MPEQYIMVRMPNKRLKYEYYRSCQLLGTTMSARIHQTVVATIRKAKSEFPQAFKMLTADEEIVFEAVEEHHQTVLDIQMYTRMEKVKVVDLLEGLVARGMVKEVRERRQSVAKGPELRTYTIIRK